MKFFMLSPTRAELVLVAAVRSKLERGERGKHSLHSFKCLLEHFLCLGCREVNEEARESVNVLV